MRQLRLAKDVNQDRSLMEVKN